MRKTMFRWLIALAILLPCIVATAFATDAERAVTASGYCGGEGDGTNLTWTLYEDGELVIEGTGAMANYSTNSSTASPWYSYRKQVTQVTIADGVTQLGTAAFANCNNLTKLVIPKTVRVINGSFAHGCKKLSTIAVDPDNSVFCVVDGVLFIKNMMRIVLYPAARTSTAYTIPDSVTGIQTSAFAYAVNLKQITLSDNLQIIGANAFRGCTGLTAVTIPETVDAIYDVAFYGCSGLERVEFLGDIPATVEANAFGNSNATIYYHEGTSDWPADDTWQGRPLEMIKKPVQLANIGRFSLEVVNTVIINGEKVEICRWVWTPVYD